MNYNHDSISSIYDQVTDSISLNQTAMTKDYLLQMVIKEKSVLEIGCGNGDLSISLAQKGLKVTGLDISKKMIGNAQRKSEDNNLTDIRFIQKDFLSYETDEKFDYVILAYFLNVFPDERTVKEVMKKVISHLKPDGYILIADELNPKNIVLSSIVNILRIPVFMFFQVTTGMKYHRIHDIDKILRELDVEIIEENRFLFQYCSVIVGKL
jgi:ubiquinone/menaquinone biosynthesis C-methylase UbiE